MPEYKTANKFKMITRDDVASWINADAEPWVKALLIFLYLYGIRIGETLSLIRSDFYVQDPYLVLVAPETALEKNRDPYPRRLMLKLKSPGMDYLVAYLEKLEPDALVFPYSRSWAWTQIHNVDPELSPHVFRHNRITEFFIQEATEVEVQNWVGHSDTRQVAKYRHRSGVFTERLGKRTTIL